MATLPQAGTSAGPARHSSLRLRYRTDPGSIARLMPPGLAPDGRSEVLLEYARFEPSDQQDEPELENFHTFAAYVSVKRGERPGWLLLGAATDHARWRIRGREFEGLPLKDGDIELQRDGAAAKASFGRRGAAVQQIETVLTDSSPARGAADPLPAFFFDYRLHYDWNLSLIDPVTPQLVEFGSIDIAGSPESGGAGAFRRVCDLERTVVKLPEATPLDPLAELPVIEILEAAYQEAANPLPALLTGGSEAKSGMAESVEAADLERWCVLRYDRPIERNRAWMPDGWRKTSSAFRLSDAEVEQWRGRKEVIVDPVDIIDIQLMAGRELHAELVPPPCRGGIRPILRLMALRVDSSEISPEPFDELWLFASCLVENRWAWYSLAHIAGPGGDVIFGRETFGYPSKPGDVSTVLRPDGFDLAAQRLRRKFVSVTGSTSGFSMGTSLDEMTVVSLRAGSFRDGGPVKGLLIEQPWYFHGRKLRGVRETLDIALPVVSGDERPAVRDPWFELNPLTPLAAATFEAGGMQRGPGRVVGEVEDVSPYYLERCDGALPNAALDSPPEPSSFRPRRAGSDTSSKTS